MNFVVTDPCRSAQGIAFQGDDGNHYRFLVMKPKQGDDPTARMLVRAVVVDRFTGEVDPTWSWWRYFLGAGETPFEPAISELVAGRLDELPNSIERGYFSPAGGYFHAVMILFLCRDHLSDDSLLNADFFKAIHDAGNKPDQKGASGIWGSWVGTLYNQDDKDCRVTVAFIRDAGSPQDSLVDRDGRQINSFAVEAATGKCLDGRALLLGPGLKANVRYLNAGSERDLTVTPDGASLYLAGDAVSIDRDAFSSYPAASYLPICLVPLTGGDAGRLTTQSTLPTEAQFLLDGGNPNWRTDYQEEMKNKPNGYLYLYEPRDKETPYVIFPPPALSASTLDRATGTRRSFVVPFVSGQDNAELHFWNYAARYSPVDRNFIAVDGANFPQSMISNKGASKLGVSDTFSSTAGASVELTDAANPNGEFVTCVTRTNDGGKLMTYLAPHTEYRVTVPAGSWVDLMCGLLGTEFIRLYGGDTVSFSLSNTTDESIMQGQVRVRPGTPQPAGNVDRIGTSYCCQALAFTAYPAKGDLNGFVGAVGAQVTALPLSTVQDLEFPMLPYGQALSAAAVKLNTADGDVKSYAAALRTFEREVMSRRRWSHVPGDDLAPVEWSYVMKTLHSEYAGPVFFDLTTGAPLVGATLRTPQGFLLRTYDGNRNTKTGMLRRLVLAAGSRVDSQGNTIAQEVSIARDIGISLSNDQDFQWLAYALAYSNPLLVTVQGSSFAAACATLFTNNEITLGDFTFRLDLNATLPKPPVMIFKLMTGIPLVSPNSTSAWGSKNDWKSDREGLLAGRYDLWAFKNIFCAMSGDGRGTVLGALDSLIATAFSKSGDPDSEYADLYRRLTDPEWTGVIYFNAALDVANMPADIQMLLGGIGATLTASYVVFDHNAIDSATGEIEQSSICALIHYDARDLAAADSDYDRATGLHKVFDDTTTNHFQTLRLNALFRHSKLAHFDCAVAFSVPKLLLEPVTLASGDVEDDLRDHRNVIVLEGRYVRQPGLDTSHVVFDSHTPRHFVPRKGAQVWRVMESFDAVDISLHPVDNPPPPKHTGSGTQVTVTAEYRIAGKLRLNPVPLESGAALDLFSFGLFQPDNSDRALALDGYRFLITTIIDLPDTGGYTARIATPIPEADLTTLTVSMHGAGGAITPRPGSLLATMPWTLVGLRPHGGSTAAALDGLAVTAPGLRKDLVAGNGATIDLALDLSAVMGNAGALTRTKSKLHARLILGWSRGGADTASNIPVVVFIPPQGMITDGRLRLQGVIRYSFRSILLEQRALAGGGTHFVLALSDLQCEFVGRRFLQGGPPDKPASLTFYTSVVGVGEPTLGWVQEDPTTQAPRNFTTSPTSGPAAAGFARHRMNAPLDAPAPAPVTLLDQSASTSIGVAVTLTLGPEKDGAGNRLTYRIVDLPSATTGTLGTVTGNTVTFTPYVNTSDSSGNFLGTGKFTFVARNGAGDSNTATMTIAVGSRDVPAEHVYTLSKAVFGRIGSREAVGNTSLEDTTTNDPSDPRNYYSDRRVDIRDGSPVMAGSFSNIRVDSDPNQIEIIEDVMGKLLDIPYTAAELAAHAGDLSMKVPGVNYDPTAGTITYFYIDGFIVELYILFQDTPSFFGLKLVFNLSGVNGPDDAAPAESENENGEGNNNNGEHGGRPTPPPGSTLTDDEDDDWPSYRTQPMTRSVERSHFSSDSEWNTYKNNLDEKEQELETGQATVARDQAELDRRKSAYDDAGKGLLQRKLQRLFTPAQQKKLDDAVARHDAAAIDLENTENARLDNVRELAGVNGVIIEHEATIKKLTREGESLNPRVTGNKVRIETIKSALERKRNDLKAYTERAKTLKGEVTEADRSVARKTRAVASLRDEADDIQRKLDADTRFFEHLDETRRGLDEQRATLAESTKERNTKLTEARDVWKQKQNRERILTSRKERVEERGIRHAGKGTAKRFKSLGKSLAPWDGLAITFVYRKLSPDVGEYAAGLTLPVALRELKFEWFTLCLPYFGMQYWTDGGWQIAVGWPFNDPSIAKIEMRFMNLEEEGPFSIMAGFKVGHMSGKDFPGKYDMLFDSIWQFGVGLGCKFEKPPEVPVGAGYFWLLTASMEGFRAQYKEGSTDGVDDYHWYVITLSVSLGMIFSINLVVASATATASAQIAVTLAFETDHATHLAIVATLSVEIVIRFFWFKVRASATLKIRIYDHVFGDSGAPLARISGPTPPTPGYYSIPDAALAGGTRLRVMLWSGRSVTAEHIDDGGTSHVTTVAAQSNCRYTIPGKDLNLKSDITLAFQGTIISGGAYNQISTTGASMTPSGGVNAPAAEGGGPVVWTCRGKVNDKGTRKDATLSLYLYPDKTMRGAFSEGDLSHDLSQPVALVDTTVQHNGTAVIVSGATLKVGGQDVVVHSTLAPLRLTSVTVNGESIFSGSAVPGDSTTQSGSKAPTARVATGMHARLMGNGYTSLRSEPAPAPAVQAPAENVSQVDTGQFRAWLAATFTELGRTPVELPTFVVAQPVAVCDPPTPSVPLRDARKEWRSEVLVSLVMPLRNLLPDPQKAAFPIGFEHVPALLLATFIDARKEWLPKPTGTDNAAFISEIGALRQVLDDFGGLQADELQAFFSNVRFRLTAEPEGLDKVDGGAQMAPLPMFPELGRRLPTGETVRFDDAITPQVMGEYFDLLLRQIIDGLSGYAKRLGQPGAKAWDVDLATQWDQIVDTSSAMISRFFLHGWRFNGEGLFAAIGQQFDPQQSKEATIVLLRNADHLSLPLAFRLEPAGLMPIVLPSHQVGVPIPPAFKLPEPFDPWSGADGPLDAGMIKAVEPITDTPRSYALKPGDWFAPAPGHPGAPRFRFNFLPTHLIDDITGRSPDFDAKAPYLLQLATWDETAAGPGEAPAFQALSTDRTFFTLALELKLSPAGTVNGNPVFEVGALEEEQRELLEAVILAERRKSGLVLETALGVMTGAPGKFSKGQRAEVTFEPTGAVLTRSNVSTTEVDDVGGSPFCARLQAGSSTPAQERLDFLTLVWEASVINAAGYDLRLERAVGGDHDAVRAYIFVWFDADRAQEAQPFVNSLLVGEQQFIRVRDLLGARLLDTQHDVFVDAIRNALFDGDEGKKDQAKAMLDALLAGKPGDPAIRGSLETRLALPGLHLNTPLAVMPVLAVVPPLADPTPLARRVRHACLPAGVVDFEFTHPPQEADFHEGDSIPPAYVSALYHLYQYRLHDDANGPEDGWSPILGHHVTADRQWLYRGRVPVVKEGENPYRMIGRQATVEFRVLDTYGNALPDLPRWTTPAITYTDELIGPSHWRGASISWDVMAGGTRNDPPVLNLRFTYQPSPGLKDIPRDGGADSHLAAARKLYLSILWQLQDPNVVLLPETLLSFGDGPATVGVTVGGGATRQTVYPRQAVEKSVHDAIRTFVEKVLTSLRAMHEGDPVQISDRLTLILGLPLERSVDKWDREDLFELYVRLTLRRTSGLAPDDPVSVPALASVTAHLTPHTVGDPALEHPDTTNTAGADHSLLAFAVNLEAAFADYDGKKSLLKVAQGPRAVTGLGHPHTLWLMKWAKPGASGAGAVQMNFPNPDPRYYAPRPLCTRLVSGSATMTDGTTRRFTGVDLDDWGRAFLNEVHLLLGPERASLLASIDPDSFRTILHAKIRLAEAIAAQLEPIFAVAEIVAPFVDPLFSGASSANDPKREYFEEQLFASLSADYSTAVMVHASCVVNRDKGIPGVTSGSPDPLFLGRVAADGRVGDGMKQFTLSNATIQVPDVSIPRSEPMNFLVSARHPENQTSLDLKLDYEVTAFDYRFRKEEELFGFIPSTWLSFVNTKARHLDGDPHFSVPMGRFVVPLPLRSFPGLPRLLGQSRTSPTSVATELREALKWDARFEFATPEAAQDDLIVGFFFNNLATAVDTPQTAGTGAFLPFLPARMAGAPPPSVQANDLFQALARFRSDYPALKGRLADPAALEAATDAAKVVSQIAALVGSVAGNWSRPPAGANDAIPAEGANDFSLRIRQDGLVTAGSGNADVTGAATQGTGASSRDFTVRVKKSGVVIDCSIVPGAGSGSWVVTLKSLTLLAHQAIRAYVRTERNSDLVPGIATNPSFVYDTPHITFPSALVPSLDLTHRFSIESPTLNGAILELFRDLTTGYATGGIRLELKLAARSVIAVGPGGELLTALLPLFLSNVEGSVSGEAVVYGPAASQSDYRQALLDQLRVWHDGLEGNPDIEAVEVDLTVFSSLTTEQLPLAHARSIDLVVKNSEWWKGDGDFPPVTGA